MSNAKLREEMLGKIASVDIVQSIVESSRDPRVIAVCDSHEILRANLRSLLPLLEAVLAWREVENKYLDGKRAWDEISEACYRNMYDVVSDYVNGRVGYLDAGQLSKLVKFLEVGSESMN